MNKEVVIRKARIEDFDEIHALIMQVHKLHVKERYDIYKDVDPLGLEEFRKNLLDHNNIYIIAEQENKIVGICFSQIREISNHKIIKDRKTLYIEDLCVNEINRRNGIGKKLYNQIIQIARDKDIDNVELMVWSFNEDAIKFYKHIGMKVKNLKLEQKVQ